MHDIEGIVIMIGHYGNLLLKADYACLPDGLESRLSAIKDSYSLVVRHPTHA